MKENDVTGASSKYQRPRGAEYDVLCTSKRNKQDKKSISRQDGANSNSVICSDRLAVHDFCEVLQVGLWR